MNDICIPVEHMLEHGFVRHLGNYGTDLTVVRRARQSYDADWRTGIEGKSDMGLIKYLMNNGHNTPFEAPNAEFEVKSPIFVFRQWHRHRTQSYNEVSGRYVELPEEFYIPAADYITLQSTDNKQMRTDESHPDAEWWREASAANMAATFELYHEAIRRGIPRELARVPLPLGTFSRMSASANLWNWMRFMKERLHPHAQYEIRVYALAIQKALTELYPISMKYFNDSLDY